MVLVRRVLLSSMHGNGGEGRLDRLPDAADHRPRIVRKKHLRPPPPGGNKIVLRSADGDTQGERMT